MLHRRDAMIRLGQLGLGALSLPGLLNAEKARAAKPGKAKSCIYLFLWGGPAQMDLWDLKPNAPDGVRSLFQPIRTRVPGIDLCEHLPLMARHTDQMAIVRSVTHRSDVHSQSVYHMLTGKPNPRLVDAQNPRTRSDFPFFGSVLAHHGPTGNMPAAVTIPRPIGHDGVTYAGTHAGFLGPRDDPMELRSAPHARETAGHPLALPPDCDRTRLQARRGLVQLIDSQDRTLNAARSTESLATFAEQAFRIVASPAAKRAFNLDLEPPRVRDRYGRNEYGDSFLLARRLAEAGVRLVSVVWMYIMASGRVSNVWDNHAGYDIFGAKTGYDLLKAPCCLPALDRAYSALLADLAERGMLDETLVVAVGEFGRTAKINANGGRDHWGRCQSALLAGGGIRGGQVYGSSDSNGAFVRDNPVAPEDLIATVHHAFGLTPDTEIRDREGRPHRLTEGKPITALFG